MISSVSIIHCTCTYFAENTDFVAVEEEFTFDVSEGATTVCFDININDDSVYEGNEQFLVVFGDISSDRVDIGPISQACVTIIDDDGESVIGSYVWAYPRSAKVVIVLEWSRRSR